MKRINLSVLMGVAVAAFSFSGMAIANEAAPAPAATAAPKEVNCILPATASDKAPTIKKLTAEECTKAGGKAAPTPHAHPAHGANAAPAPTSAEKPKS